ncbi:GNAT family N-acetyltransferase [Alicyclobacillus sp. ALC3]|uniref:GNAT family N-acetyltransferase n=1 Tax=Alicyclobacillus sp. ALC3 TaxID=2796143 RepID=UPI003FCD69AB
MWVQLRSVAPNVSQRGDQTAHVHQLSVVEPEHRRGFGSALMEHVANFARTTLCVQIELDYWA